MKKNKIHTSYDEYEVSISHNELETIVANAMQTSEVAKAPFFPALKLIFLKDAANNIMVKGNWREKT